MDKLIPERAQKCEQATGLKRSVIAQAIGCGTKHLGRVINGKKAPSKKLLRRLATKFNVSAAYLTGLSDSEAPVEAA